MKLSKHQKRILITIVLYVVATIALNALFYYYGHWEWNRVRTNTLAMLLGAVCVGVVLIIGSRIPKKKDKDKG
ncbi:MAG: hypothetical protein IJ622_04590 [Bacteroidales bacterium]|nr:hypothetical protein [Bacteroidales bacterium]